MPKASILSWIAAFKADKQNNIFNYAGETMPKKQDSSSAGVAKGKASFLPDGITLDAITADLVGYAGVRDSLSLGASNSTLFRQVRDARISPIDSVSISFDHADRNLVTEDGSTQDHRSFCKDLNDLASFFRRITGDNAIKKATVYLGVYFNAQKLNEFTQFLASIPPSTPIEFRFIQPVYDDEGDPEDYGVYVEESYGQLRYNAINISESSVDQYGKGETCASEYRNYRAIFWGMEQERSNCLLSLRGGAVIDRALARLDDSDFNDFITDNGFDTNLQPTQSFHIREEHIKSQLGSYLIASNQYKDHDQNLTDLKLPKALRSAMLNTILASDEVRNLYANRELTSTELYMREFFAQISRLKDYELLYLYKSPAQDYLTAALDVTSSDFDLVLCPEASLERQRDWDAPNYPQP